MLPALHYLAAYVLLHLQSTVALPQGIPQTEISSTTTNTTTPETSLQNDTRTCDFETMDDFFDHAVSNNLNITIEVQNCQNLCLLTYGVGNPDLSGIGMMYAYSIQTGLTILVGPLYRLLYLTFSPIPPASFIHALKDIQTNFFSSNGFFVASSAFASLAHLSQNPSTFEIAEIQAMAFLQVNSILVTFFCLVVAQPMSRWAARVVLYIVVFILVVVVLGKSHLNGSSKANWRLASDGCAHSSTDYSVINPVPYPSWTVAIFAVAGTIAFWLQSLKERFQADQVHKSLFRVLMAVWILLIGLLTAGMVVGLTMMWRQRRHLRSLARDQFEDDGWGFGQIAALTIWAPVVVELLYILNDLVQKKSSRWTRWNKAVSVFFSHKSADEEPGLGETTPTQCSQPEEKGQGGSGRAVEVAES
ncbi:hypothetical protein BJX70DRAFT_309340 [Aspergillus crustosus]